MSETEHTIVKREPWPKHGIESYSSAEEGAWGYLLQYSDGSFVFDEKSVPTTEEVEARWHIYF